jgi:transposase-like zinc-binding protein
MQCVAPDPLPSSVQGAVASPSAGGRPRTVFHRVLREHLETFLAEARAGNGDGLPRFVERELREFLACGVLARGFARLRCDACKAEMLVAFSCKGRGFCPSCCGRRMAECAAHLVDGVLGGLPIRQWVLTLPYRLRYALAWDHRLCRGGARRLRPRRVWF